MKLTFRQGIIRSPSSITAPQFLQKSRTASTAVDLIISPDPVVFTIAHQHANYLFEETRSIDMAWGGGQPGSINGPMPELGQTQFLFWDINMVTGELTRGWTLVPPIVNGREPTNPDNDTHWFDLTTNKMKVYKTNSTGGYWQDKIRLFAAEYSSSGQVNVLPIGSQVGINTGNWSAGNLILGVNNKPLRQSDGTFVTTESDLIIYQTSGQNVKFDMTLVYAQASEEIAKFYLVSFLSDRRISLASSNNYNSFVSGIVTEHLYEGEVGQIISNGVIRNEQWNWLPSEINKPVFCGPTGEITLSPPKIGVVQQVGYIYDEDSIYLNLYPPIRLR